MTSPLDTIINLIEAGSSPAEIRRSLYPEAWKPLLKACAAAGTFDRSLFDTVLRPSAGQDAPALDELTERERADKESDEPFRHRPREPGIVEEVPGRPGHYRLPPDDREEYMQSWRTTWTGGPAPVDLVVLEQQLADYWKAVGDQHEQLRHLLVADPPQALALFEELFAEADRQRDFARCQDLLDVLNDADRLTLSGPDIARVRRDRAGYIRAQSYWAVDYARCAQYLAPPGLKKQASALLRGSGGRRTWQVFAEPGMGKTMQLRWLVTRYCVPAKRDIPCARIDFDVVSPVAIGHHPWLALLEMAEQFDIRSAQRTFGRLESYASFRSLLDRRPSDLNRAAAQSLRSQKTDELQAAITDDFVDLFNAAASDQPSLLVCDTMEELLLRGQQGTVRFLELLTQVQDRCPGLRIVLAGRYELGKRLQPGPNAVRTRPKPPKMPRILRRSKTIEIGPFTDRQAETYLRKIRGITDPEKRAVARHRANGRPLTLALFADAIEQDPELSAAALADAPEPSIPFLIDRVVRRIKDPKVRWLVRYGVVPRRLRREDLPVMLPFLRTTDRPTARDDPRKDSYGDGDTNPYPFTVSPMGDAELERTWLRLLDYADESSWVSQVAGDPSTVIFHPDVRVPQRLILSAHEVFAELHCAFAQHFETLAARYPNQWADFTCEALYHRFHVGDPQAGAVWRAAMRQAREDDALDDLLQLATEVLGDDFLEEGESRLTRDGRPLIPYADLLEAHLQRAYVFGQRAMRDQASALDSRWSEAEGALSQVDRLREHEHGTILRSGQELTLRATLQVINGRPAEAAKLAEQALAVITENERIDLLRVLGDLRFASGDPSAQITYEQAYKLAVRKERTTQATAIALCLARDREAHGRLDEALHWCKLAEPPTEARAEAHPAALTRARLLLACCRPATALHILRPLADGGDTDGRVTALLLTAQAELMLGRGEGALETLDRILSITAGIAGVARYQDEALVHQLRATVLGELLAVDHAEQLFHQAASMWADFGYRTGHPECRYLHARFLLREVGDLREADRLLAAARTAPGLPADQWASAESESVLRTELLGRELALAGGDRPSLAEAPAGASGPMPPRHAVILAAHRLVEEWGQDFDTVPALADALEALQPPSARLFVLDELRRCPTLPDASEAMVAPLRRVLATADEADDDEEDQALHRALLGELDRLAGGQRRASTAEAALRLLGPERDPLAYWRWIQFRARLGAPLEPKYRDTFLSLGEHYPLLQSAVLLQAVRTPSGLDSAQRGQLLEEAAEIAAQVHRPTRWAADTWSAYAEIAGVRDAARVADQMYKRLGLPHRPDESAPAYLSSPPYRPDQLAIGLATPAGLSFDRPELLQRRMLDDPSGVVDRLHAALNEAMPEVWLPDRIRVLRLESDDPAVHALPWELAVTELGRDAPVVAYRTRPNLTTTGAIMRLQAALRDLIDPGLPVDGFAGPRTRRASSRLTEQQDPDLSTVLHAALNHPDRSRRRSLEPPTVVVVAPSETVQYQARGGHRQAGVDLTDIYASCGLAIQVAELVDFRHPLPGRPSLVHVSAPLESTAGEPYFDLSAVSPESRLASKSRGSDLSATALALWLQDTPDCIVVLDPPVPGSLLDIPEQLLRRNYFAAQLASELPAAAILGIGLNDYHTYPSVELLATAVREERPLADTFRALVLRRLSWTGPEWLAAGGTSLFAAPVTFMTAVLT
ncbi:hypothetical protein [Streptomyces doebereineriae]|uniref:Uncharacterized protein n=1 Tax=Streptomyces doebereineriae TaxID=3075528 RepID=A0ABU2V2J8_9ACTN|nr:hypothetical protein [Streptomyces sp. DSM 41640]MDT0479745.1 hypothetical protein [Streptomyces sp. DSM 41640]